MKHFMVGQKASDEAKIDSDFYAILLRYELHESMEKQITSHRFQKESVRGFWLQYVLSFSLRKEADKI